MWRPIFRDFHIKGIRSVDLLQLIYFADALISCRRTLTCVALYAVADDLVGGVVGIAGVSVGVVAARVAGAWARPTVLS